MSLQDGLSQRYCSFSPITFLLENEPGVGLKHKCCLIPGFFRFLGIRVPPLSYPGVFFSIRLNCSWVAWPRLVILQFVHHSSPSSPAGWYAPAMQFQLVGFLLSPVLELQGSLGSICFVVKEVLLFCIRLAWDFSCRDFADSPCASLLWW